MQVVGLVEGLLSMEGPMWLGLEEDIRPLLFGSMAWGIMAQGKFYDFGHHLVLILTILFSTGIFLLFSTVLAFSHFFFSLAFI